MGFPYLVAAAHAHFAPHPCVSQVANLDDERAQLPPGWNVEQKGGCGAATGNRFPRAAHAAHALHARRGGHARGPSGCTRRARIDGGCSAHRPSVVLTPCCPSAVCPRAAARGA
eukprot:7390352-Prymnesium_polylepis.1